MVADAINDTLKAIAASLLMSRCWRRGSTSPRRQSAPSKVSTTVRVDTTPRATNIGFNEATGQLHLEIKGLATPTSPEASRICQEDLLEVCDRLRTGQDRDGARPV